MAALLGLMASMAGASLALANPAKNDPVGLPNPADAFVNQRQPALTDLAEAAADISPSSPQEAVIPQSSRLLAEFPGAVRSLSSDQQYVLTSSSIADATYLCDRSGNLIAELVGYLSGFSPDEQFVVAGSFETGTTGIYDLSGQQVATLPGYLTGFSMDGQQLTTYSEPEDLGRLYDFSGKLLAEFQGSTVALSADGQVVATASSDHSSYVYNTVSGQLVRLEKGSLRGDRPVFVLEDQYVATHPWGLEEEMGYLYSRSGSEVAQLRGSLISVSRDQQHLITFASNTYLYDLSGQQIAELEGQFRDLGLDDQHLITHSYGGNISRLYDFSGRLVAQFSGEFVGFSPDGLGLFTNFCADGNSCL
ncbi:MAG: hypothetical protein ICV77_18460, partial [Cyanobacteria bacterium Co-bin8]|nr:hypothetical protein [Cyanobacteria bacterium Co-bin8]